MRRFVIIFFGLAVFVSNLSQVQSSNIQSKSKESCKDCIKKHEKQKGIEPGLLEAIVQIESKFNPYAVNACGRAYNFESAAEAAKFVQDKQNQGYENISVGVAQLHVPSHRSKFPNVKAMCELDDNLDKAAKLLKRLKQQTGSWERAVKRYHSADPDASERYRGKVFGAWAKIRKVRGKETRKQNPVLKIAYKEAQEAKNSVAKAYLLKQLQSLKTCKKRGKGAAHKKNQADSNQNVCDPAYLTCITCGSDALLSYHATGLTQNKKVHDIVQTVQ